MFAVFNNFDETRVRVRHFTKNSCSCSTISRKIHLCVRSCSVLSQNIRVRVLFAFMSMFGINYTIIPYKLYGLMELAANYWPFKIRENKDGYAFVSV